LLINEEFEQKLNSLGKSRLPFFFAIDFEGKEFFLDDSKVLFRLGNKTNVTPKHSRKTLHVKKKAVNFLAYKQAFDKVIAEIKKGNTYLFNLTFSTLLEGKINLEEVFFASNAPFKILVKEKFVCFSPERFIAIKDDIIETYPMKGTIDASVACAKEQILSDKKEKSEHVMVVDLLRNDLGIIASNIKVEKFRYVQKIKAGEKELLQVSSKITGKLDSSWHENIGTLLCSLLPAGSISGTPKKKTIELIKQIETHERGFFSGVFGYYDAKSLDTAVMIRFIEKTKEGYIYKSGGGITLDSDCQKEYEEMKDKVYVPML
jgi:para-aminobenzoate synthetase component 1